LKKAFPETKKIIFCLILFLSLGSVSAGAAEMEQVNLILDKWTSFHWGEGCFVWLLHYPEEIVDPWTDLQFRGTSPSPGETDKYRNSFRQQLLMDEAEAFLLSIVPFGNRVIDLAPMSEKIFLVQPGGENVPPLSYDEIFDKPMETKTQGLVFFPKQEEESFVIQIRDLGVGNNGIFRFPSTSSLSSSDGTGPEKANKIVLMKPGEGLQGSSPEDVSASRTGEDMAEELSPGSSGSNGQSNSGEDQQLSFDNRDELMISFLDSWIAGNYEKMYSHLSEDSRNRLSLSVFTQDMMQSTFRVILMNGYTLKWTDQYTVEVTGNVDMVMMSRLKTRIFTIVEENDGWKISR